MITTGSTSQPESHSAITPVSLEALKRFLKLNQWHLRPDRVGSLLVYEGAVDDAGRPIMLTLPTTAEFEDAPEIISKVLNVLAIIRCTSSQAIRFKRTLLILITYSRSDPTAIAARYS